jgi:hypothetical protein
VIVYAVVDDALSPDFPLGVELEVFIGREDAERFIEEVRGDDPEVGGEAADRGAGARGGRAELDTHPQVRRPADAGLPESKTGRLEVPAVRQDKAVVDKAIP